MLEVEALEFASGEVGEFARVGEAALFSRIFRELRGNDVGLAAGFESNVFFVRMKSDGQGSGQRPGGRRPDDGEKLLAGERGVESCRIVEQRVLHPHRGTGVVFVFDLGLGERSFVVHAPVDGTQALIDEPIFVEREESGEHHRLILRRHGGVGLVEAAEYADALELLALQVKEFLRVLAAFGADIGRSHLQLLAAQFFVDLDFNGQAVAIPTRHVGSVEPGHGFGFDDEILEALVHGCAQVDRSAGVRRSIVEHIGWCALTDFANAVVDPLLLPPSQDFGLILGQPCLHGEAGFGQIDGGFQVRRH